MWKQYKNKEISEIDYANYLAKKRGFKDFDEYQSELVKKRGFQNYSAYQNYLNYENGKNKSMSENKECPTYLGIHLSERLLAKIWNNERVIRMPNGNRGYDFICGKGFKVDVKSRCFNDSETKDFWIFQINRNKIADYFLLLAFDNREDLNPLHIWLIKGDEIINNGKLNDKTGLRIQNSINILQRFNKYEQTNKLEELKECCNNLKGVE